MPVPTRRLPTAAGTESWAEMVRGDCPSVAAATTVAEFSGGGRGGLVAAGASCRNQTCTEVSVFCSL